MPIPYIHKLYLGENTTAIHDGCADVLQKPHFF